MFATAKETKEKSQMPPTITKNYRMAKSMNINAGENRPSLEAKFDMAGQQSRSDKDSGTVPAVILIVTKDASVRKISQEISSKRGYDWVGASSAEEARDLARNREFSVALCDIHLPGESGYSFVRWLTVVHPETAAIFMASPENAVPETDLARYGAHRCLIKPFSGEDLKKAIAGIIHERPAGG